MNSSRPCAEPSGRAVWLSAVAFCFLMGSYYIIRPVRDQLSGATGSAALPLFYGAVFVAMLLITPVFGWLAARFPRRVLLAWSYGFFMLCLLGFVPAFAAQARIGARTLGVIFYVWVSIFNLFVVSLFWSFMADIHSSAQARRTFSLIALGGMAGAVLGPLLNTALMRIIGVAPLMLVSAVLLGLSLWLLLRMTSSPTARIDGLEEAPIGGSPWEGLKQVWFRPFVRNMALLMLFSDGIGTLAYAMVADYAKAHYPHIIERTEFYNAIDLGTNLLGAVLQLTATRWLMVRLGAGWALLIPSMVNVALLLLVMHAGGGALTVFGIALPCLAVVMATTRGFTYGMAKPAADALYTRVPRQTRYQGKNFVETMVWRFGDVLTTSGIRGLRALGLGIAGLAGIGTVMALCGAMVARRVGWSPDLAPEAGDLPGDTGKPMPER